MRAFTYAISQWSIESYVASFEQMVDTFYCCVVLHQSRLFCSLRRATRPDWTEAVSSKRESPPPRGLPWSETRTSRDRLPCGRHANCFHAPDHRVSSHRRLHLCALPLTSGRNQLLERITWPHKQTYTRFPRRCFCCQRILVATWVPKSRHSAVCRWCPLHCINYTTVYATASRVSQQAVGCTNWAKVYSPLHRGVFDTSKALVQLACWYKVGRRRENDTNKSIAKPQSNCCG